MELVTALEKDISVPKQMALSCANTRALIYIDEKLMNKQVMIQQDKSWTS